MAVAGEFGAGGGDARGWHWSGSLGALARGGAVHTRPRTVPTGDGRSVPYPDFSGHIRKLFLATPEAEETARSHAPAARFFEAITSQSWCTKWGAL